MIDEKIFSVFRGRAALQARKVQPVLTCMHEGQNSEIVELMVSPDLSVLSRLRSLRNEMYKSESLSFFVFPGGEDEIGSRER